MGASVAGLWAARVLADYADEVIVLERDTLPESADFRSGTPQARQYHVMLLRGLQIMDEIFPGIRQELIDAGAVSFDIVKDVAARVRGRWLEQFPSNQMLLSCSRLLLEAVLRRRVRQIERIRLLEQAEVIRLIADETNSAITGVEVRWTSDGAHPHTSETILYADFVVDALGRRSPTPQWLADLGYPAPHETVIDSFLGYVTRRYRKPATLQADWQTMLLLADPPSNPRGGLIFPEEHGSWVVMMAGANKDYPPVDEAGFDAFARSLGPEFHRVVREGEPISKPYGYRGTDSRRRHYELLERWPERLVIMGDAICGFNPIYGQGMTVAALEALTLGQELRRADGRLDGVAQRAIQSIARTTEGAWLLATSADLEWPETTGADAKQGLADRFGRWYLGKLLDAMSHDRALRLAFLDVNQLMKPVTSLFAPDLMLRVLRRTLF